MSTTIMSNDFPNLICVDQVPIGAVLSRPRVRLIQICVRQVLSCECQALITTIPFHSNVNNFRTNEFQALIIIHLLLFCVRLIRIHVSQVMLSVGRIDFHINPLDHLPKY